MYIICFIAIVLSVCIIIAARDTASRHIFYHPGGPIQEDERCVECGWYFWDEAGLLGGGPYHTYAEAEDQLEKYARQL